MEQIVTIIHICTALALIVFILLQQGKGAEAGASFGAGASQTIFGSQGTGSLLTRITAILACTFFVTSLILGYLAIHVNKAKSIDELLEIAPQTQSSSHTNTEAETQTTTDMTTQTGIQTEKNASDKTVVNKKTSQSLPSKEDPDVPKLPINQIPSNSSSSSNPSDS